MTGFKKYPSTEKINDMTRNQIVSRLKYLSKPISVKNVPTQVLYDKLQELRAEREKRRLSKIIVPKPKKTPTTRRRKDVLQRLANCYGAKYTEDMSTEELNDICNNYLKEGEMRYQAILKEIEDNATRRSLELEKERNKNREEYLTKFNYIEEDIKNGE